MQRLDHDWSEYIRECKLIFYDKCHKILNKRKSLPEIFSQNEK